jgi:hypothetical protein
MVNTAKLISRRIRRRAVIPGSSLLSKGQDAADLYATFMQAGRERPVPER